VPFSCDMLSVSCHILSLAVESESSVELLLFWISEAQKRPLQASAERVGGFQGFRERGGCIFVACYFVLVPLSALARSHTCTPAASVQFTLERASSCFRLAVWAEGRVRSWRGAQLCASRRGSVWRKQLKYDRQTPSKHACTWVTVQASCSRKVHCGVISMGYS